MNHLKPIRLRLEMTQQAMATDLGCTQSNVGHYERGQTMPPEVARKLIQVARGRGLHIGFDHVYDGTPLPELAQSTPSTSIKEAATPEQKAEV